MSAGRVEEALGRIRALLLPVEPGTALLACDELLASNPRAKGALALRAHALLKLKRTPEALAVAAEAALAEPGDPDAFVALGFASVLSGKVGQALAAFDRAIALQPTLANAYAGRGLALAAEGRGEDAIAAYLRAVELDPGDSAVFIEVGRLMLRLGRLDNAHAAFLAALKLQPNNLSALEGRTKALIALNRHEEALPGLAALRLAKPTIDYLQGSQLHARLNCCEWREFDAESRTIIERIRRGEAADAPLSFTAHCDSAADQRRCAQMYALDRCSIGKSAKTRIQSHAAGRRAPRLRIAYLSADFRNHPVGQQLAGVIESHDRSRLEIFAFAAGPSDGSLLRQRIERAVDHFLEVGAMQDVAIAARMAELSIDIAVDLGGYTTGNRTRVLAYRPAPVQVAFLGFPGTLGADFIDYIVADEHVIPEGDREHYTEQVIYMPDTYMPADFAKPLNSPPSKLEAGLPPSGTIFCSFNAPYKLNPGMFNVWMRILKEIPDGILWLRDAPNIVKSNLAREAAARGVDPTRLIYAAKIPTLEDHYARLSLADVFLDSYPYNAHTTASDALAAEVPVITLRGKSFASRVGTSLLHAVGLGHLSVETPDSYAQRAVELAREPDVIAQLKAHLRRVRTTTALFDPRRYCRYLEAAYLEIAARHERDEAPAPLWIQRAD